MTRSVQEKSDYYGAHPCSLANTMRVVAERWTFLILREALGGTTRFSDFRATLGLTPDTLSARLATLVEAGVITRDVYREDGQRARDEYVLTEAGRELKVVLAALQQWADVHTPSPEDPMVSYRHRDGSAVEVAFAGADGRVVDTEDVQLERTAAHPLSGRGD